MSDECEDEEIKAKAHQIGGTQDPNCCDTETVKKIPDELREPVGELPTTTAPLTPENIPIYNHIAVAYCDSKIGQFGDPSIIEEHYINETLYLSDILTLTDNVIQYVARHHLEPVISDLIHKGELTPQWLTKNAGFQNSQAAEFVQLALTAQESADNQAQLAAQSLLQCYWLNTVQIARCSDTAMVHPSQDPSAVYEAVVEANTFRSSVSQEDANAQALQQAESMLNCFYTNKEFIARCEERPGRPEDEMEPVPNDEEPIYPGQSLRVGVVKVDVGLFRSSFSQEEADQLAQDYGYGLLNCWYPNYALSAECDDPDARNLGVVPEGGVLPPPVEADPVAGTQGQIVKIPEGMFRSEISRELATQEAESLVESLLQCCFSNDPIHLECAPENAPYGNGIIQLEPDTAHSGATVVDIAAGEYFSCQSKADANAQAEFAAAGRLQCMYCNKMVYPTCVPDWIIDGVKAGALTLPLDHEQIISYGGHSVSPSSLSISATSGIPDGAICDADAWHVQQLANILASIPVSPSASSSNEQCTYYNDLVVVGCAVADPYNNLPSGSSGVTPDGRPYYFFTLYPPGTPISGNMSNPAPNTYIEIPAGMFSGVGEDCKYELNQKAINFGRSLLMCMWVSPEIYGTCSTSEALGSPNAGIWYVGRGDDYPESRLAPWAHHSGNPLRLSAGMITIIGAGNDADEMITKLQEGARQLARSMVICVYTNEEQRYDCPTNINRIWMGSLSNWVGYTAHEEVRNANEGVVPKGTIVAETPEEADNLAKNLAVAIAACDSDTWYEYFAKPVNWPSLSTSSLIWSPGSSPIPPGFTSSPSSSPGIPWGSSSSEPSSSPINEPWWEVEISVTVEGDQCNVSVSFGDCPECTVLYLEGREGTQPCEGMVRVRCTSKWGNVKEAEKNLEMEASSSSESSSSVPGSSGPPGGDGCNFLSCPNYSSAVSTMSLSIQNDPLWANDMVQQYAELQKELDAIEVEIEQLEKS